MKIQLKRSNVLEGDTAKEPTAAQIEYGELAVNYNNSDSAIFIKDSADNIIRIAGKGSITSSDTPSGDDLPSSGNKIGELFFDTSNNTLNYWNGNEWIEIKDTVVGDLTYTYPGGVEQTVQARLEQRVSVKDFGAVGDGTTDDTAAVQNAIDNAIANFKNLHIPAGNYALSKPLIVEPITDSVQERAGIKIYGDGTKTVLDFSNWDTVNYTPGVGGNDSDLYAFTCINNNVTTNNWIFDAFEVSDLKIIGPGANYTRFNVGVDRTTDPAYGGYGPDAQFPSDDFIKGLHGFGGESNSGGYIVKNIAVKGFDCGFRLPALQFCYFENLRASKNRIGCWLSPSFIGANAGGNSNIYNNCYFTNNFVAGAAVVGAFTPFPFQNMEFNNLVTVGNTLTGFYAYGAGKITLKGYQTEQNGFYSYSNNLYNLESTFNFNGPTGEALTIKNGIIHLTSSAVVVKAGPANTNTQPLILEDGSRIEFNDGVAIPAVNGYTNTAGNWVSTISEDSFVITDGYTPQKTLNPVYSTVSPISRYHTQKNNSIGSIVESINTTIDLTIPNSAIATASSVSTTNYPATVETGYATTVNKQFLTNDPEYGTVQKCRFVSGSDNTTPCRIELSSDGLSAKTTDAVGYEVATSSVFVQFLFKLSRTDESMKFNFNNSLSALKPSPALIPNKWYLLQKIINNKTDTAYSKVYVDLSLDAQSPGITSDFNVSIAKVQVLHSNDFGSLGQYYRAVAGAVKNQSYNPGNNQTRYLTRSNSPEVTDTKNLITGEVGDVVYNNAPAADDYLGWVCVTAGTPGTWKGFGLIDDRPTTVTDLNYTYPGGVERTVQSRLSQYVSVEDFGAVATATNSEPSLAVAQANTAAFAAAFEASSHVYVTGTKPNLNYFVTDTINVGDNRLEGPEPGNFGKTGVSIRCHSGFNVNNPLIKIASKGRIEELELIGISSGDINNIPVKGIEIASRANKVSINRIRMQYFRNGLYADGTQNSLFSDMQVKFCPEACFYLNETENCKFVNINSDQDIEYTPALTFNSRNILIDNQSEDGSHSRNLSFYMGIHERGNLDIDHCVELRGGGGIGLLFVDGEYNGGRKSAINVPGGCAVVNPRFSLQGDNLAITNATAFTETSAGSGVFYPSASTGAVNLSGGISATGLNGKSTFQIVPRLSTSNLFSDKFGFIYSLTQWSGSSGGSITYVPDQNALQISGTNSQQGGRRGAFTLTSSPTPGTVQLAGRNYKITIKVRSFVNCTGVRVYASRLAPNYRRTILTVDSEGYHEAVVPANASDTANYDIGSFELAPDGVSGGTATFLVDMFIIDIV